MTYESDGYAVAPTFLSQVDAHIQQVLAHADRGCKVSQSSTDTAGFAGFLKSTVAKLSSQGPETNGLPETTR